MSKASRVPCIAMFAVAAIAALSPDRASAQSCGGPNTCIVVTIGGVGTFAAVSYQWGVPGFPSTVGAAPELTFA